MKLSAVSLTLMTLASSVVADSCNQGGVYCGISLLNKGNYHDHIVKVLQDAGQPTSEAHIDYSKFDCLSGGNIVFREFCSHGCGGTTSKDPDYCL